jgi:hypothetical protein
LNNHLRPEKFDRAAQFAYPASCFLAQRGFDCLGRIGTMQGGSSFRSDNALTPGAVIDAAAPRHIRFRQFVSDAAQPIQNSR